MDCVACHSKIEHFFRSFAHFEVLSTSAFGLLQISVRTQGKDAKLASWAAYLWYISEFKRWYLSDLSTWTLISLHVHLLENILFLFSRCFFEGFDSRTASLAAFTMGSVFLLTLLSQERKREGWGPSDSGGDPWEVQVRIGHKYFPGGWAPRMKDAVVIG